MPVSTEISFEASGVGLSCERGAGSAPYGDEHAAGMTTPEAKITPKKPARFSLVDIELRACRLRRWQRYARNVSDDLFILAIVSKAIFESDALVRGHLVDLGDVWTVDRCNSSAKGLAPLREGGASFS